tara:strand:+ start:228 stop:419 length:192 start_codon:yes stop_codon:yes gene_type:complete
MNHNIILGNLTKYQDRVEDIRRELSEQEEALIRSQAIVMIDRNVGKEHIVRRVLKRFQRCVNV